MYKPVAAVGKIVGIKKKCTHSVIGKAWSRPSRWCSHFRSTWSSGMSKYVLKYLLVVKSRVGRPRPYLKLFKKIPMTFLTFTKYIPPYFDLLLLPHLHLNFVCEIFKNNLIISHHLLIFCVIFVIESIKSQKLEGRKSKMKIMFYHNRMFIIYLF